WSGIRQITCLRSCNIVLHRLNQANSWKTAACVALFAMIVFAVNQPLMSARPGKPPLSDRELSSWKEIAEYLNVSIRTAQAWERSRGMPVHRVPGVRGVVTASA